MYEKNIKNTFCLYFIIFSGCRIVVAKVQGWRSDFLGFGIIKRIGCFSKDIFQLAFQHDLAMGIVSMLIGAIMLF